MNLADALVTKTFKEGTAIIKQGDVADGMYFIEDGIVAVTIEAKDGPKQVRSSSPFSDVE
jgi:cAMP-dependent protein kinase regulator